MLAKLMKDTSIRDSCHLVDIVDVCIKENTYKHLYINGLESCFLDGPKNKITKEKVYEEVLDKSLISSYQSFEVRMTQSDKSKK